jgi:hypothetical protein
MSDDAAPPRLPAWFFALLGALTLYFLVLGIVRADRTTLRGDEVVGVLLNRSDGGLGDLVVRGEVNQISPAPLFYIVHLAANASKSALNYLGLTPPGYYRLPSLLFTAGLGVAAALLVALRLRRNQTGAVPYLLVLCAVAAFWFHPKAFAFAGTARPYALWNGLWFLAAALLLWRPAPGIAAVVVLSLLATSATASCFQIFALGIALVVLRRIEGRPMRAILREGALLLALPALLSAYYAIRSRPFDMDERDTGEAAVGFLKFWLVTNLPAWIAGGLACGVTLSRPKLREYALPALAFSALVLLMPLVFGLAHYKGYASPSRQYIWTTTGVPLLLFIAALGWAEIRTWRLVPGVSVLAGIGLAVGLAGFTPWRFPRRNDSRDLACLQPGSPLMALLQKERPGSLIFPRSLGTIEGYNLFLIAEWIDIRYAERPKGIAAVAFADEGGRLEAVAGPLGKDAVALPLPPDLRVLHER